MKTAILKLASCAVCVFVLFTITNTRFQNESVKKNETTSHERQYPKTTKFTRDNIPLSMVICKNPEEINQPKSRDVRISWKRQKEQFRVLLASILYFSNLSSIKINLFTDSIETHLELMSLLDKWPPSQRRRLLIAMQDAQLERLNRKQMTQWRPCAWSKMYIPEMLPDVGATIYLDSDVLFLGRVEDLWSVFETMGEEAAVATAPEMWYLEPQNKDRPAAGRFGINTGVMFMNLTRLRDLQLSKKLMGYSKIKPAPRHDQDVLNAYLMDHPQLLHEVSARYNFSPSSCHRLAPPCQDCFDKGILLLHGADSSFFKLIDAKMKAVYKELQKASVDIAVPLAELAGRLEAALHALGGVSTRFIYACQHLQGYDMQIMRYIRSLVQ